MRKHSTIAAAILATAVAAVLLTGCGNSATETPDMPDAPSVTVTEVPVVAPVGATVTHNGFTYTVMSVAPGVPTLPGGLSGGSSSVANGVFIAITLDVTNNGKTPDTPRVGYSRAYDAAGHQFACSSGSGDYAWSVTTVNPGNSASGYIAFDVPPGTVLTTLEIRSNVVDDAGVRVAL